MKHEAHNVEAKEAMVERFLQVSTTLQGIFDHYKILMGAISILFHHCQLSSLLVIVYCQMKFGHRYHGTFANRTG